MRFLLTEFRLFSGPKFRESVMHFWVRRTVCINAGRQRTCRRVRACFGAMSTRKQIKYHSRAQSSDSD